MSTKSKHFLQIHRLNEKKSVVFNFVHFRILWFVLHLSCATIVVYGIGWSLREQQGNPFVTTLYDTAYQSTDIGYPLVYACPNNIMSRARATAYAERL